MRKICLLIFLLCIETASAFMLSPAKMAVDFEPAKEVYVTLRILNTNSENVRLLLSASGELSSLVSFENETMTLTQNISDVEVHPKLSFPASLQPGKHEVLLTVREYRPGVQIADNAVLSSVTELSSKLIITVPYPETYLEADLQTSYANKILTFSIPIYNLGNRDLYDIAGRIDVFNPSNEQVAVVNTNKMSLKQKESGRLQAELALEQGDYTAHLIVYYADKEFALRKVFRLGAPELLIKEIEFLPGEISKLNTKINNTWNRPVNVFAHLKLMQGSRELAASDTATIAVSPGINQLAGFLGTKGVASGTYNLSLQLNYEGKISERVMSVELAQPARKSYVLYVYVLAIAVIIFLVIILMRRRRKQLTF